MRKMQQRSPSGFAPKTREIDASKGAARQAAATRGRLRLHAAREVMRSDKSGTIIRDELQAPWC